MIDSTVSSGWDRGRARLERGQLRSPSRNIGAITQPSTKSKNMEENVSVGTRKLHEKNTCAGFSTFYGFPQLGHPEELTLKITYYFSMESGDSLSVSSLLLTQ